MNVPLQHCSPSWTNIYGELFQYLEMSEQGCVHEVIDTSLALQILADWAKLRTKAVVKIHTTERFGLVLIQERVQSHWDRLTPDLKQSFIDDASEREPVAILDKNPNLVLISLYASRR